MPAEPTQAPQESALPVVPGEMGQPQVKPPSKGKKKRSLLIRASGLGVHLDIYEKLWAKKPKKGKDGEDEEPEGLEDHFALIVQACDTVVAAKGPVWANRKIFGLRLGVPILIAVGLSLPLSLAVWGGYRFIRNVSNHSREFHDAHPSLPPAKNLPAPNPNSTPLEKP